MGERRGIARKPATKFAQSAERRWRRTSCGRLVSTTLDMQAVESLEHRGQHPFPRNVKVLGWVSFSQRRCQRDDLPAAAAIPADGLGWKPFFFWVVIEGIVDSASSIVKLWSGGWSTGNKENDMIKKTLLTETIDLYKCPDCTRPFLPLRVKAATIDGPGFDHCPKCGKQTFQVEKGKGIIAVD